MARAKKFGELRNKDTGEVLMQMMAPRAEEDPLSVCLRVLTYQLTLKKTKGDFGGGLFGGPFGYGVDFENDTFEMHYDRQDYDCTCGATEPIHLPTCDTITKREERQKARIDYASEHKTDAQRDSEIAEAVKRGVPRNMAILGACSSKFNVAKLFEWDEQHPWPPCSCGVLSTWKESDTHSRDCQDSIARRPCFTFKPSGFAMDWYKYIGRDNEIRDEGAEITLSAMFEECLVSIGAPSLEESFKAYIAAEAEHADAAKRSMAFWMGDDSPQSDDAVGQPPNDPI